MSGVVIEVIATGAATPATWNDIWSPSEILYDTDRGYVEQTLRQHQRLALFRAPDRLAGMASIDVYPVEYRGRRLVVIFTGHVLLRPEYRGQNLLQRLGFRTFIGVRLRYPLRPIYWFVDTLSYKSYLLMPRNLRECWPRYDRPTPAWERGLMDFLARRRYGEHWRPEQGIVARSERKQVCPETAQLAGDPEDPHLEFYARANPGHAEGDMLVCLCPLSARNWLSAALHALRR